MAAAHAIRLARPRRIVLSLALGVLVGGAASAQSGRQGAPTVETSFLPAGDIGVDEMVQLKVSVTLADDADVGRPRMDLENLDLVAGPGESNQILFSNGVTRRIVTFTWTVRARAVGEAKLTGGSIQVGGREVSLPAAHAQVLQEPPPRQSSRRRDPFGSFFDYDPFERGPAPGRAVQPPKVFLEAAVEPSRPWVGQQVTYTIYLYTNVNVRSATVTDLPEFAGAWALPVERNDEVEPQQVDRDGQVLSKFVLMQKVLFPRRAGRLDIGPAEVALAVVKQSGGFFSGPSLEEMRRRSNTVAFDVRELPQPAPAGFQGAVGEVTVRADVEPRDLEMGDAATLRLVLDGRGHLQGVPAPEIPHSSAYELFPPQQQSHEEVRGNLVFGTRTWSYVLVPKETGALEIPPIRVPFFDPRRGTYRVAETEPLRLAVRGSTRATQDSDRTVELHPIRASALPAVAMGAPVMWPAGRHAWFGLPMLAALLLLVLRRSGLAPGSARAARRKRLLDALAAAEGSDKPRQVAAAIEDAWRDYLEARFSVPRGTASSQWSRLMTTHGASRDAAEELVALADDLHYLRYAPKLSSTDEMQRELVERSRRLARRLG